jgi:hypothetical protein
VFYRLVPVNEAREIELKLVTVPRGIRALYFTELALEASVHYSLGIIGGDTADIAIITVVDEVEKDGEAVTVFEAHAASVTDLEGAGDFLLESFRPPIKILVRVVAQAVCGEVRNVFIIGAHRI